MDGRKKERKKGRKKGRKKERLEKDRMLGSWENRST